MKKIDLWINSLLLLLFKTLVAYFPSWTIRKLIYRVFGMKIGKGSRIGIGTMVVCPWKIQIGSNTIVNENCYLDGRGGLQSGDNLSLSLHTIILSASHDSRSDTFAYVRKAVRIEDYAWIGARAIILEGSQIGRGCLIGAGSTFRGIAEDNYLYSGVPAKKVRLRGLHGEYTLNYHPPFI